MVGVYNWESKWMRKREREREKKQEWFKREGQKYLETEKERIIKKGREMWERGSIEKEEQIRMWKWSKRKQEEIEKTIDTGKDTDQKSKR